MAVTGDGAAAAAAAAGPPAAAGGIEARVVCRDAYEALKLASLAYPSDGRAREGGAFATEVVSAYGDEIVLSLRDGSAHSVMLADAGQAEALADFMQSVSDGEHAIAGARAAGASVLLAKSAPPGGVRAGPPPAADAPPPAAAAARGGD